MFSGLPLRTANTTTELVTKPSYLSWFQSGATRSSSTSPVTSGSSESAAISASRPAMIAFLWSPEGP